TVCTGGAPVAGAVVTLENGAYFRTSDATGAYSVDLPPGTYNVTVSRSGYAPPVTSQVTITNGNTTTFDACLQAVTRVDTVGTSLVAETCNPPNGALDPGEQVTVSFCLRNLGALDTTNLVATLLPGGGVSDPSAPQTYGVVVGGGAPVCQDFT